MEKAVRQRPGRGQIFFRARYDDGSWGAVDVFDLDDESFRAIVLDALQDVFISLSPEAAPDPLRAKPGLAKEADDD